MAFNKPRSGDRLLVQQGISTVPKTFVGQSYAAPWAALATANPQVGDLVIQDSTISDGVKQCPVNIVPYGMVWSINSFTGTATTGGTLSILLFEKVVQVILEGPNNTDMTANIGNSVQANGHVGTVKVSGNLRDQVKNLASAVGGGRIVSVLGGHSATSGDLIVVEWPRTRTDS